LLKEEEMVRKLQLDATVIMKASDLTPFFEKDRDEAASIQEDSSLSTLTSDVVDMEDNALELDDIDLETINNGAVEESLLEDDFTSTVFPTTGTQKKL